MKPQAVPLPTQYQQNKLPQQNLKKTVEKAYVSYALITPRRDHPTSIHIPLSRRLRSV